MKNWVKMGSAVLFALAVVQSAVSAPTCHGTLHFKAPDNWAKMYVSVLGGSMEIPRSALNKKTGYYDFDLDQVAEEFVGDTFALADAYDSGPVHYVLQSEWNGLTRFDYSYPKMHADIACPGEGMDVWVLEDPKHPGETFVSSTKPDIKVLFVLPPDDEKWFASTPMMNIFLSPQYVAMYFLASFISISISLWASGLPNFHVLCVMIIFIRLGSVLRPNDSNVVLSKILKSLEVIWDMAKKLIIFSNTPIFINSNYSNNHIPSSNFICGFSGL